MESYGAFIEFRLEQEAGQGSNTKYRGLAHISQLAPHRVEKVEDILRANQEAYAVILEVNGPPGREKIRLSLVGVDQTDGTLTQPSDLTGGRDRRGGGGGGDGGGRGRGLRGNDYRNFRLLQDRAKQRREMFKAMVERYDIHWWETNGKGGGNG